MAAGGAAATPGATAVLAALTGASRPHHLRMIVDRLTLYGCVSASADSVFDSLVEGCSDLVTLHDVAGVAVRTPDEECRHFPHVRERLAAAPLWRFASEGDAAYLEGAFRATAGDGETRYIEWKLRGEARSGDQPLLCETRISRLAPSEKEEPLLLCITRFISGGTGRDDRIRSLAEERRSLVDRAAYGIYRSTADGRFVDVNRALVKMLGYSSAEELFGLDMAREVYVDPAERDLLLRRVREGRLGEWSHVRWRTKEGSTIIVRIVVNAITNEKGEVRMFEGIAEDVTESLRREEILRRNERMASLGTMLAGVAHELNNPLAAISGFAQIILRGSSLSNEDRAAVETINHEANRAARIVRDLQTFARERTYLEREEVDLNEVVSYVLATQRYKLDARGIQREVALAPALAPVRAERAHVEQVLINLLSNATLALESITDAPATRASGEGARVPPTITVRTMMRDGSVLLEIQDNGPGISGENLPRIFDPFFTTRREGEGSGLGLAVVHGIINSYGGNLEVESEEGRGTLFRVGLPAVSPGPEASVDQEIEQTGVDPTAPPPAPVRPLEILVVEDEAAIRRLLSRYFESRGHSVAIAENGLAALRQVEQSAFDVVVCDLRLPGIDGFEVIRRIRELPTGKRSRCILMSGANARVPSGPLSEVLRLSAIINKPFEIEQLRGVVEWGPSDS